MYPVSTAFLTAVKANTRKYYWTGRITTKAGDVYDFDQNDIVKGSGYISSQCSGSTEIELGTVYAAEMGIFLFSEIDRYTLEDAMVTLSYHLQVEGGSYEEVPMGVFEVSEANRRTKCLEIKAYDYMLRFEKNFNGFETIGAAFDFVNLCCQACRVVMAQDQAFYESLPNGTENLSIYSDNDIETYRDVLYYVGQVLGGFFVINRAGQLELRKYGNTAVEERYFLCSIKADAELFSTVVRRHWHVENLLHWILDVTFREDSLKTREKKALHNLGLIRRCVLSLLKILKAYYGNISYKHMRRRIGRTFEAQVPVIFSVIKELYDRGIQE